MGPCCRLLAYSAHSDAPSPATPLHGFQAERPPVQVAAARLVICHAPLYRLLMLLPGPECVMGPCTASHCCCQARNLPWAPVPTPHAAARPVICHGPLYRLLMLLPGQ
ncbi:unnamed protein product, partial [Staurois parvus]